MGKVTNFTKIKTVYDLVSYLDDPRRDKDFFYHYTTFDRLELILKNRTFVLSSFSEMNDRHEEQTIQSEFARSAYVGSFSRADNEVMAMWGMYAIPWEKGVRIGIPKTAFRQWIRELDHIYAFDNYVIGERYSVSKKQKKINAVCYYDKLNQRLDWSNRRLYLRKLSAFNDIATNPQSNGYVKHKTWSTEEEIRVLIKPDIPNPPIRIVLEIPQDVIDQMVVVLGPNFDFDYYRTSIESLNIRFERSEFTGLINVKDTCKDCRYRIAYEKSKE